jgi:hypothetical protein
VAGHASTIDYHFLFWLNSVKEAHVNRSELMFMWRNIAGLRIAFATVVALVASGRVESQAAGTASDGPGDTAAWTLASGATNLLHLEDQGFRASTGANRLALTAGKHLGSHVSAPTVGATIIVNGNTGIFRLPTPL